MSRPRPSSTAQGPADARAADGQGQVETFRAVAAIAPRRTRPRLVHSRQPTEPVLVGALLGELVDELGRLAADLWLEGRLDAIPRLEESLDPDD